MVSMKQTEHPVIASPIHIAVWSSLQKVVPQWKACNPSRSVKDTFLFWKTRWYIVQVFTAF